MVASPGPGVPHVQIARQAIVDRDQRLHAYELLFRAGEENTAHLSTPQERDAATSHVLSVVLGDFGAVGTESGLHFFVNLTRSFVVGDLPVLARPEHVTLEVTEDVLVDDAILAGLRELHSRGYALALDDFDGEEHRLPCLPMARYVKLELLPDRRERLAELVAMVRRLAPAAAVVVERVETEADFEHCKALGVDYFQGYWIERPVIMARPSLDTSRVTALRLMSVLADPDTPIEEIERVVTADAALSLKVLRVASSSAVATRVPIHNVRQALVLLGPRMLSAWAALAVVGSSMDAGRRSGTTAFVLARAGACALLSQTPQEAYTVGLISGAAEALGLHLDSMLSTVNLAAPLRAALLHHQGPVGEVLAAVLATECSPTLADGQHLGTGAARTRVLERAGEAYATALGQALALTGALTRR